MAKLNEIQLIERHATRLKNGHEKVQPGMPYRISEAATVGDGVWQGDLGIEIVSAVPMGHARVESPTDADRQLVPGNTQGARHCLDSLAGVELYRAADWPNVSEIGPCLRLAEERTIEHPTHGSVTVPAGFTVLCSYQREWDSQLWQSRRNAD